MTTIDTLKNRFVTYYEKEADPVLRFCMLRVFNTEQAIDIMQETFSHLWEAMKKGEKIKNIKAFLFTVSHRLIIDWYRKKKDIILNIPDDSDSDNPIEEYTSEDFSDLEIGAEGRYLLDQMQKLSPLNKQAIYLRYVEGLSPTDIAKVLRISADTVSVRVNRGLNELRKITNYLIKR